MESQSLRGSRRDEVTNPPKCNGDGEYGGLCSVGLGGLVGGSGRNGCGQGRAEGEGTLREGQELVGNNSGKNSGGLVAGGSGGG